MLLTSLQHRRIAKRLWRKAALLPPMKQTQAIKMEWMACLHLGLARAQERNPSIAPAAKNPMNRFACSVHPCRPKLVHSS
jgi:hypothetical protein